jgi:hypothetical protein
MQDKPQKTLKTPNRGFHVLRKPTRPDISTASLSRIGMPQNFSTALEDGEGKKQISRR